MPIAQVGASSTSASARPGAAASGSGSGSTTDPKPSPFAFLREHPLLWIALAAVAVIAVLGAASFALGSALAPPTATTPVGGPDGQPAAREAPQDITGPKAVTTCSVASQAGSGDLGGFSGYVADATSGTQFFSRDGSAPHAARGTLELFTAASAMQVLGADTTLATTVYSGSEPGEIVIVGGGDPTLTALPDGQDGVYPMPTRLSDLVTQVQTALAGQPVTKIVVDASLWPESDSWSSVWDRKLVGAGFLAPVTALQVDGGRADPTKEISPRNGDPVKQAAEAFATALGVPDAEIADGALADGATMLGQVQSQPVSSLVATMLQLGDAQLAEQLARLISLKSGGDGTLANYGNLIPSLITQFGLDADGVTIVDGSGLSGSDGVPPKFLASVATMLRDPDNAFTGAYNAIAVAGQSGLLLDRFTGDASAARGKVTAQAGSGTLTGIIAAQDDTVFEFSFTAGATDAAADAALDALAAAVYACGANLSNH